MTDLTTQKSQLRELVAESNLLETEKEVVGQLIDDCSDVGTANEILRQIIAMAIKSADDYLETLRKTKELFSIGQQMVSRRKENPEASIDDLLTQMEALKPYFE